MNVPRLRFDGFDGEWKIHQLKEYFDFIDGDRGPNYPNEDDFNSEGHCVFLNAHNISENGLIFNRINWLSEEIHRKLRKGTVERGDLILTSRGSKLGKLALYDEKVPFEIMRINSAMLLIRKKRSELDSNYSLYLFKESLLPKFINANKVGSAQPHITVKDIKRLNFSMPQDISEQKKIARFFGLLNQRIEKQQEVIEKLEQFKKGMMQKIFSQELRFKDENGGEFGEWASLQFGDVVEKLIGGGTPSRQVEEYYGGSIPWVTVKDLKTNKYVADAIEYITELGLEKSSSKIVDPGDLIIPTRMAVGRVLIATEKVAINQDLKGCKLKFEYDTEFIYYLYFSKSMSIEKLASGSTVTGINIDQLMKIRIQVPILKEQKKIADYLGKLDKKIEKEKEKLMVLEEQKKGFMQGMFP